MLTKFTEKSTKVDQSTLYHVTMI